jgi:hypothetical protein
MARQCFCGCGRNIPLHKLVLRSHSNAGHEVAKHLTWMRDGLAETDVAADAETQRWLDEGDTIVDVLARAAHGELRRPNLAAVAEWRAEGRDAERKAKVERLQRMQVFGHLIRKGADPREAAKTVMRVFSSDETPRSHS